MKAELCFALDIIDRIGCDARQHHLERVAEAAKFWRHTLANQAANASLRKAVDELLKLESALSVMESRNGGLKHGEAHGDDGDAPQVAGHSRSAQDAGCLLG